MDQITTELEKLANELKLRNYSPKTSKSYLYCVKTYFEYKQESLVKVDQENIKLFLLSLNASPEIKPEGDIITIKLDAGNPRSALYTSDLSILPNKNWLIKADWIS